jgi:fatty-acyl-CoA synthase
VPKVEHFVAFEGARPGWLDYETTLTASAPDFEHPHFHERDLLSINYTSGTVKASARSTVSKGFKPTERA